MAHSRFVVTLTWCLSGLLVCGVVWLVAVPAPSVPSPPVASATVIASSEPVGPPAVLSAAPPPNSEPQAPPKEPLRDLARATQLRESLMALYGVPPETDGAGAPSAVPDQSTLAPYVQGLLQDHLAPIVSDCYAKLLTRFPAARGRVALELAIMGDPAFGGAIANTALAPATTLKARSFQTCLQGVFATLVLPSPPQGHAAFTIEQSFELEP